MKQTREDNWKNTNKKRISAHNQKVREGEFEKPQVKHYVEIVGNSNTQEKNNDKYDPAF